MTAENLNNADISLLVCTFNRASDLDDLLRTVTRQTLTEKERFEIIVVDNNSSDNTKEIVSKYLNSINPRVTYLFEPKQGKSNALNAGLRSIRTSYYTVVDDDFLLPEDWVEKIVCAFRQHPEVTFVSGKVLPTWQTAPPSWLSSNHWAALAMADYGDEVLLTDGTNQLCLLACSFKTKEVLDVGGYRSDLGVTCGQIGGIEDLDLLQRLWMRGRKGIYLPSIWFHHKVTVDRCTKKYHRLWHAGHGAFYAAMRDPEFEKSRANFLGVPLHLYRQAMRDLGDVLGKLLTRRWDEAFLPETRLRFFFGFSRKRIADARREGSLRPLSEISSFFRRPKSGQSSKR